MRYHSWWDIIDNLGFIRVVSPDVELKIYLVASPEERARGCCLDLLKRGERASYGLILGDLKKRHLVDSKGALSPLQAAGDAEIVDTDGLAVEQVPGQQIVAIIEARR